MNDTLYGFLSSRVDKEVQALALSSSPGLPIPEAAELGRGLLFNHLKDLVQPVMEAWLEEELIRVNPAVALSPLFGSAEDRENAEREIALRMMSPEGNPFAVYPLLR